MGAVKQGSDADGAAEEGEDEGERKDGDVKWAAGRASRQEDVKTAGAFLFD